MAKPMKIQLRRDAGRNWNRYNPVLLSGEMGLDLDNNSIKIGDGRRAWQDLPYFSSAATTEEDFLPNVPYVITWNLIESVENVLPTFYDTASNLYYRDRLIDYRPSSEAPSSEAVLRDLEEAPTLPIRGEAFGEEAPTLPIREEAPTERDPGPLPVTEVFDYSVMLEGALFGGYFTDNGIIPLTLPLDDDFLLLSLYHQIGIVKDYIDKEAPRLIDPFSRDGIAASEEDIRGLLTHVLNFLGEVYIEYSFDTDKSGMRGSFVIKIKNGEIEELYYRSPLHEDRPLTHLNYKIVDGDLNYKAITFAIIPFTTQPYYYLRLSSIEETQISLSYTSRTPIDNRFCPLNNFLIIYDYGSQLLRNFNCEKTLHLLINNDHTIIPLYYKNITRKDDGAIIHYLENNTLTFTDDLDNQAINISLSLNNTSVTKGDSLEAEEGPSTSEKHRLDYIENIIFFGDIDDKYFTYGKFDAFGQMPEIDNSTGRIKVLSESILDELYPNDIILSTALEDEPPGVKYAAVLNNPNIDQILLYAKDFPGLMNSPGNDSLPALKGTNNILYICKMPPELFTMESSKHEPGNDPEEVSGPWYKYYDFKSHSYQLPREAHEQNFLSGYDNITWLNVLEELRRYSSSNSSLLVCILPSIILDWKDNSLEFQAEMPEIKNKAKELCEMACIPYIDIDQYFNTPFWKVSDELITISPYQEIARNTYAGKYIAKALIEKFKELNPIVPVVPAILE